MKGEIRRFFLAGRACVCLVPENPAEKQLPLAVLCGWELEALLPFLGEGLPDMLLFSTEIDGCRDFTPWPAPGVWEGETFTGEAAAYLSFLTEEALPYLERELGASPKPSRRALLGYSLGGLFTLWAAGQSRAFSVFASLSGSLWYDGFLDYLQGISWEGEERVYLSLGDREEFGGPPRMRRVGDCTREAAALLEAKLAGTVLEWNKGGHGKNVRGRWKKALCWAAGWIADPNREGGRIV